MPFRHFILHNFWLKLCSLVFAGLIWFAVSQSDQKIIQSIFPTRLQTLELRCPISLLAPPASHPAVTLDPATVIVKVAGEDAALKRLSPESIQVYVKLPDGPSLPQMARVQVIVPREVALREVTPDQVSLRPEGSTARQ